MRQFSSKLLKYLILFFLLLFPIINLSLSYFSRGLEISRTSDLNISSNGFEDVDLSFIPDIDYTSLNDQWYNHKIEMLIITPNNTDYINAVKPLMEWKNEKGVKTIILSNFSLYEGRDDAEKIRNMIKSYYEKENIQWVLLASDAGNLADELPIRMVYNPDVIYHGEGQRESVGGEYYKPTDYYYADLTGTWDSDGDGIWGENSSKSSDGLDEIDWVPDVYVGRFPANNSFELENMVNKTVKYESNPFIGDWMNKMLLAGAISGPQEDEAVLTTYIWSNYIPNDMEFTHLHRTGSSFDPPTPPIPNRQEGLSSTNVKTEMNLGYSTAIIASHGYYSYFKDNYGDVFTASQAKKLTNSNMPFLLYGDACTTSSYDINDDSIGEILINKTNGGAIGYIGGLRVTWYYEDDENLEKLNRGNAKLFWEEFYLNEKFQQGRALYDSKVAYINSDYYTKGGGSTTYDFERKNLLTYSLLGDPEVDIYTNIPKKAMNPFTEDIYEGQLISAIIKDVDGKVIPRARVHLEGSNGKYFTEYADYDGYVKFRLLNQANEFYNVTITGHNLIPSYFNFTTITDDTKPELVKVSYVPRNPSPSEEISFNLEFSENKSGIESAYLFISGNNFKDFMYYSQSNGLLESESEFRIAIDKLIPGDYSYFVFTRDYLNNSKVFSDEAFKFTITKPLIDYVLPVSLIIIIGIAGISAFTVYKSIQKYSGVVR
ncbi:hypothetical protein LCGC14_1838970 [marine sediment metagenome]|uniref:Gingipain domain-containing protein n=1 Tax=marine sediment metagenome TaxID=412755 RepID=A0A0F9GDV5_9ZZZZ